MSSASELSLIAVCLLAALHLLGPRLHGRLLAQPSWFSIAGGMSVAYVLVYLLPELADSQREWLAAWPNRPLRWLDRQVYLAALLGLLLALGIDYRTAGEDKAGVRFWLNMPLVAMHNLIIGAVGLHVASITPLVLATVAFGAHFAVTDHMLQVEYGRAFARYGRWVLAAALAVGWAITAVIEPHVIAIAALLGLLSGSIILEVIKQELPHKRAGRFSLFVVGTLGYAVVVLALVYYGPGA